MSKKDAKCLVQKRFCHLSLAKKPFGCMVMCDLSLAKNDRIWANWARVPSDDVPYLPFQIGSRFSANARAPSS